jgi:hypothetical protein
MKGLPNVRAERSLAALASNLKRVMNLLGVPPLVAALAREGRRVRVSMDSLPGINRFAAGLAPGQQRRAPVREWRPRRCAVRSHIGHMHNRLSHSLALNLLPTPERHKERSSWAARESRLSRVSLMLGYLHTASQMPSARRKKDRRRLPAP